MAGKVQCTCVLIDYRPPTEYDGKVMFSVCLSTGEAWSGAKSGSEVRWGGGQGSWSSAKSGGRSGSEV